MWQSIAVAVPALLLALTTGLALGHGYGGQDIREESSSVGFCQAPPDKPDVCQTDQSGAYTTEVPVQGFTMSISMPWGDVGVIGGSALGAATLTALLGVAFLRASTSPEELRTT
jgi:hypothetical protein